MIGLGPGCRDFRGTRKPKIQSLLNEGAGRLLARASDNRSLNREALVPRIAAAVEKYLLEDDPDTPHAEIAKFIDEMQADDLCLIIACERGDENAWNDLVERFTSTVRSAARSASANEDAAEDLAQSIWAELYGLRVRKDGMPAEQARLLLRSRLAGRLVARSRGPTRRRYVSQTVAAGANRRGHRSRSACARRAAIGQAIVAGIPNPEESMSNRFAQTDMQQALSKAVQELAAEDRLLVKLYYFDNLRSA